MAQKPMMRADVYARALRASRDVIKAPGGRRIIAQSFLVVFGPILPARMVHEVSRTEELVERRRAHSADHAGLEVGEHRAWYVYLSHEASW
jgi:hypothetical protein